jgi:aerobic-type carbon monoxide dehydrogenase small subunit (CoxS/CutS family)
MKTITCSINGVRQKIDASPEKVLLDLLRDDLHLTGAKQSCDRKGQCGACTDMIEDIKYLCICDPTANVIIEVLCSLVKGKSIAEAQSIREEAFSQSLGTADEEMLKRGLTRYLEKAAKG